MWTIKDLFAMRTSQRNKLVDQCDVLHRCYDMSQEKITNHWISSRLLADNLFRHAGQLPTDDCCIYKVFAYLLCMVVST